VPRPGGDNTPWWVWLLVGVAGLVILALTMMLLLKCLRRRQAARQLVLAPPAHKARDCATASLWCLAALAWSAATVSVTSFHDLLR
jgi:hypothetical protein